jgi:hypothetical protein
MKRFELEFPTQLVGINFATLEESKHTIVAVDETLMVTYVNSSWVQFANSNAYSELTQIPLGSSLIDSIAGRKIKDYYVTQYANILQTGEVWMHDYECSSRNEYRTFRQIAFPLKDGKGLILSNALRLKLPMQATDRKAHDAIEEQYIQKTGFIIQCTNCRHTLRADNSDVWDWVPEWVDKMPNNCNHTICQTCYDYYWKFRKTDFKPSSNFNLDVCHLELQKVN